MVEATAGLVAEGRRALRDGDWETAHGSFAAALEVEETGEALFGCGEALWWTGQVPLAIEHRERAYVAYQRGSDPVSAARVAMRLCVDYRSNIGNLAASAGWLARASRLVQEHGLAPLEGWVLMLQGFVTADAVEGERHAREAADLARSAGDRDLELSAMSVLGTALIAQGRTQEGTACLDESMAASLAGEGPSRHTTVFTSCNMIKACTSCADLERAIQWVHAADRFMQRYGCAFLYATCRTQFGAVLVATGEWARAEEELQKALAITRGALPAVHAEAVAELAELRIGQGRLEEAERLIASVEQPPTPVVARLHLLRGRPAAAAAVLERRLRETDDVLESGRLQELLGEAALAIGDSDTAADRGRQLTATGSELDCSILAGRGERLLGRAASDPDAARAHLSAAFSLFGKLGLTYESARTRLYLAEALADEPEIAILEAESALAVLDGLGANREADAAAAFLRARGVTPKRLAGSVTDLLTEREGEVLALVSEGLSNPEIAQRLYLSRRTVEHHVGSILAKLGVRSRTEAARRFMTGSVTG